MSTGATVSTRAFTLHYADCLGNAVNCIYPHEVVVADEEALKQAVSHDYVAASYVGNYRSNANFISSNCVILDVDNEHSDDPKDWAEPLDVALAFPDVCFAVHYSRNHMKEKNGKAARPKFHVLFPIEPVNDAGHYCELKRLACKVFPFFDSNALDAGRFFFGSPNVETEFFDGPKTLAEFLEERNEGKAVDSRTNLYSSIDDCDADDDDLDADIIPKGQRNTHMSQYAARILVRLGDTEEAHRQYLREAKKCSPPLSDTELQTIWDSARRFFYTRVVTQPGYISPAQFSQQASAPLPTSSPPPSSPTVAPPSGTAASSPDLHLCPADFTDVGQAIVLAREYENKLRYSEATGWLFYNGSYWEENDSKAQSIAQELTARQLKEVETELSRCKQELINNGAWRLIETNGIKKACASFSPDQKRAYEQFEKAQDYKKHILKSRDTRGIAAALRETRPMLPITPDEFDCDPFLLNTPSYTYNLKTMKAQEHNYKDFITKQTAVDPSDEGIDYWEDALFTFFCGNDELIDFVQMAMGFCVIGKVMDESLYLAHGGGNNGKSTLFNTLMREMGSYAGTIPPEVLLASGKDSQIELAALQGKRMVIAAELGEGLRFDSKKIKQACSTDRINARRLYHDPFSFVPTHKLIVFTNFLPSISERDEGTWRRIVILPFNAKIQKTSDIKNYSDFLHESAGGAVLKWMIEGAEKIIANHYRFEKPPVVLEAIQQYRDSNDWLVRFLEEACDIDKAYEERSGDTYAAYRQYCKEHGESPRSTTDFYSALEAQGFTKYKKKSGRMIKGLRLKSEFFSSEC